MRRSLLALLLLNTLPAAAGPPPFDGITCVDATTAATESLPDGKLKGCKDAEGRWHGFRVLYDARGRVTERLEVLRGKRHGFAWTFRPDGTLATLGAYEDDLNHGIWSWYIGKDERKVLEGEFRKGMLHGIWVQWDTKGVVLGMTTFTNGTGHFVRWLDSGERAEEGDYEAGVKKGIWRLYRPDMSIEFERFHQSDKTYLERLFDAQQTPTTLRCVVDASPAWEAPHPGAGRSCP